VGGERKYLVDFDSMAWASPMPGVRQKIYRVETRVLRLVEYSRDMLPHWCDKGHIGHIVEGQLSIEFKTGTDHFGPGDALFIPAGSEHAHRALPVTPVVTALFVEDAVLRSAPA
jgi:mannose-6-phosphate isomerase-like protein (cupin superfamily)